MHLAKMPALSLTEHVRLDTARCVGAAALSALSTLVFGNRWISLLAWGVSLTVMWLASNQFVRLWGRQQERLLIDDKEWSAARAAAFHTWPLRLAYGFMWGFVVIGVGDRWAETRSSALIGSLISGVIGATVWVVTDRLFGD